MSGMVAQAGDVLDETSLIRLVQQIGLPSLQSMMQAGNVAFKGMTPAAMRRWYALNGNDPDTYDDSMYETYNQQLIDNYNPEVVNRLNTPGQFGYEGYTGYGASPATGGIAPPPRTSSGLTAQDVNRAYQEALGRSADPDGMNYWLSQGGNYEGLLSNIMQSEEFKYRQSMVDALNEGGGLLQSEIDQINNQFSAPDRWAQHWNATQFLNGNTPTPAPAPAPTTPAPAPINDTTQTPSSVDIQSMFDPFVQSISGSNRPASSGQMSFMDAYLNARQQR